LIPLVPIHALHIDERSSRVPPHLVGNNRRGRQSADFLWPDFRPLSAAMITEENPKSIDTPQPVSHVANEAKDILSLIVQNDMKVSLHLFEIHEPAIVHLCHGYSFSQRRPRRKVVEASKQLDTPSFGG
jgi:hypothetical protein